MTLGLHIIIVVYNFMHYMMTSDEDGSNVDWYKHKSKQDLILRFIKVITGLGYACFVFVRWMIRSSKQLYKYYIQLNDTH